MDMALRTEFLVYAMCVSARIRAYTNAALLAYTHISCWSVYWMLVVGNRRHASVSTPRVPYLDLAGWTEAPDSTPCLLWSSPAQPVFNKQPPTQLCASPRRFVHVWVRSRPAWTPASPPSMQQCRATPASPPHTSANSPASVSPLWVAPSAETPLSLPCAALRAVCPLLSARDPYYWPAACGLWD